MFTKSNSRILNSKCRVGTNSDLLSDQNVIGPVYEKPPEEKERLLQHPFFPKLLVPEKLPDQHKKDLEKAGIKVFKNLDAFF